MALLLFPEDSLEPQLAVLLDPNLRLEAADSVNKAILDRQSSRREAAIRQLVKMRSWAERKARKNDSISLPERIDIGLKGEDMESHQPHATENGHDLVMT